MRQEAQLSLTNRIAQFLYSIIVIRIWVLNDEYTACANSKSYVMANELEQSFESDAAVDMISKRLLPINATSLDATYVRRHLDFQ